MGANHCKCGKKIDVIVSLIPLYGNDLTPEDIENETSLIFKEKNGYLYSNLCKDCFNKKFNLRKGYFIVRGWRYNISFL